MVWLTAAGLCIGLLMVGFFLLLVLSDGVSVFWPKSLYLIGLKPGSQSAIGGAATIGGAIAKKREKAGGANQEEWQIFVGNRDVYGVGFKYIDAGDALTVERPRGAIAIERLEYGDSFGFPKAIRLGGTEILAGSPEFVSVLSAAVAEGARRREKLRRIERNEIGAIDQNLNRLALFEKRLARESESSPDRIRSIAAERVSLKARHEAIVAQARSLRDKRGSATLVYALFTGQQKEISADNIAGFSFPNDLSLTGKIALFFQNIWNFLSQEPREANTEGGIFPAIVGTFVMTVLMSAFVTPLGVVAAIYLREYATQGPVVRTVRVAVNNLAGVPSIVFGVFGLGFFIYLVGGSIDRLFFADQLPAPTFGTGGMLWASLTLALMTVPVVIVSTEEALVAVPRGMREGSLACGASKWQTIQNVVLPASSTGILTGLILAMARGAGEVAPLMLVGVVKLAPSLPIDSSWPFIHLDQKFMHLGFYIYDLGFQSPDSEAAIPMVFAATLFLILLVIALNLSAILIREHLRKKYATGAF